MLENINGNSVDNGLTADVCVGNVGVKSVEYSIKGNFSIDINGMR